MTTVQQLLQKKPAVVWSVSPEASVYEALELMAEKDVGAVPVLEDESMVGIFSERDYARKIVLKGKTSRETKVGELMTRRVVCVGPEQTVDQCMGLMTAKRVRHLPVLDGDKLVGIVTIGDLVGEIIAQQESTIQELENYIKGSP